MTDATPEHATPASLEARLAAELKTEIENLTERYETGGPHTPAHPAVTLRADILVPLVLGVALDTLAALEGLVADPPPNLRTRARMSEQLRYRATYLRTYLADAATALVTTIPPADIAEAIEAACIEVVRLEDHAAHFAAETYDPTDEAGEAASFMAATVRGEAVGARRILAILLGLPTGEGADGGQAEAYVADHRAARAATLEADEVNEAGAEDEGPVMPQGPGPIRILFDAITAHTAASARTWANAPLFVAAPADLMGGLSSAELAQIKEHGGALVPVTFVDAPPPGARIPAAALDGLADRVAAGALPDPAALGLWLGWHGWDHAAQAWVELEPHYDLAARAAQLQAAVDAADPECERCDGSGLDPDTYTTAKDGQGRPVYMLTDPCPVCRGDAAEGEAGQ